MRERILLLLVLGWGLTASAQSQSASTLVLLHTNDLHSHYRPANQAPYLGGVARLKTLIDRERRLAPHSLLVDAGDWTEGQIYYNLGAGAESYRMMGRLGYDIVTLGNHDWLNGPDAIMNALKAASIPTEFVASNAKLDAYSDAKALRTRVPEVTIREIAGVRIGFIGLLTFEFIYDQFLKPIQILSPFKAAIDLSQKLKKEQHVDFVVALSHNRLSINQEILKVAPEVDLIIGAHDHKKVVRPIRVDRPGHSTGILVETGRFGEYLGKLTLALDPQATPKVSVQNYELLPLAPTVQEDPEIAQAVDQLEGMLEDHYGPIFHDHVSDCEDDVLSTPVGTGESEVGDLLTDAVKEFTHADISIDHPRFIYGSLKPGPVRTADIMNIAPAVYNLKTDKSWTVKTIPIKGSLLNWLFNILFSPEKLADGEAPSFSGIQIVYDPVFKSPAAQQTFGEMDLGSLPGLGVLPASTVIRQMTIDGKPVQANRQYQLGMSGGMFKAIEFLNSILPGMIPLDQVKETGVETWKALEAYIAAHGPMRWDSFPYGVRKRTVGPDIAIVPGSVHLSFLGKSDEKANLRLEFQLANVGLSPSAPLPRAIHLTGNDPTNDPLIEMKPVEILEPMDLNALEPGDRQTVQASFTAPLLSGSNPISIRVQPAEHETATANNTWVVWFEEQQESIAQQ